MRLTTGAVKYHLHAARARCLPSHWSHPMHPDDTTVPEDDRSRPATRRALDALGLNRPGGRPFMGARAVGARDIQRRRVAAAGTACAIVLVTVGGAVAATGRGGKPLPRGRRRLHAPTHDAGADVVGRDHVDTGRRQFVAHHRDDPTTGVGGTAGPSTTLGTLPADAPRPAT